MLYRLSEPIGGRSRPVWPGLLAGKLAGIPLIDGCVTVGIHGDQACGVLLERMFGVVLDVDGL
jgi:hypothetical protein